jgi:hypothetical protein
MPRIKRKCPALPPPVVCDYPAEVNVLDGVVYDSGAKTGNFDENARNVDPGEVMVLTGVNYKIKNVAKAGLFDEDARNVDPTEALVIKNTLYRIKNVGKSGTFDEDARNVDPTEALVIKNTNYKIKNVAKVGSFDEAARNIDPAEANVADGVAYKIQNVAKTGLLKPQLPKTDQVSTFGLPACDGVYQDGNPISPRFVDNGDNTVSDKATGLMWIKRPELIIPDGLNANNIGVEKGDYGAEVEYDAGDIVTDSVDGSAWVCLVGYTSSVETDFSTERGGAGSGKWSATASVWAQSNYSGGVDPKYQTWNDAVINIPAMTKSLHADWKLPNIKQLMSIVNYENVSPAIDTGIFPNTKSDYYWSSTVYAGDSGGAWGVVFVNGDVSGYFRVSNFFVRPVRQY